MARESSRGNSKGDKRPELPAIKIITPPLRLSYPKIFDPVENDQGQDVWETDALVPPTREGDKFLKVLDDALYSVMTEYFGPEDEWPSGKKDGHPDEKIRKVDPAKAPPGINADWSKITARSYQAVGVVDADKNEVLNKREAYGGRWARLSLTVSVYDNKSKGPTIYLNNVQLLDHDESFGGRASAESDFDRWDGDDLAPGGARGRGRDDDGDDDRGGRSRVADRGGRGDGRRSPEDGRRADRAGARQDRDEGRSDREDSRDRGRSGRDDAGASRGRVRDDDRGRDDRVSRGDGGTRRDGGAERNRGDGRRRPDPEDGRGGGRSRRDDADSRDTRARSRDDADDRADRGRGRGRDDDQDRDDPRPSQRGRDDRDDRDDADDWN